MPDEATDTAEATTTTETAGTGGSAAAADSDVPPEQLPYLSPGDVDPAPGERDEHGRERSRWVTYLQQMINYTYQQQEVMEIGYFDDQTAGAVRRLRNEKHLPAGDYVDKELWLKLGAEDLYEKWAQQKANKAKRGSQSNKQQGEHHDAATESFEDVEWGVTLVSKTTDSSCWAAALAIVLNFREGSGYDVDVVCERGNTSAEEWTGAQRAEAVGQELGLRSMSCMAGSAAGWAEILANYGPAWSSVPGQDYLSFVVGGVRTKDGHTEILVLDPEWSTDSYVAFTDFAQSYGFSEQSQVTILV